MENKKPMKFSEDGYDFIHRMLAYRVTEGSDKKVRPLCEGLDILHKYFKDDNDRFIELIKMEVKENGNS